MQYLASQNGETVSVIDDHLHLVIHANARTDMGMVRPNNEDNVQIWAFRNYLIGMVADGMGGAAGGEHASRLAVETIQTEFVEMYPDENHWDAASEEEIAQHMTLALSKANQSVLDKAAEDHELHGMGTTTTMVLLRGKRALVAHIGDSRAYLVEGHSRKIAQISKDHSFVEALVLSGHLTPEQAAVHPMKNVLYRALGQKPDADLEVDLYTRDLQSGDRLILCSDGLPRHVTDFEIGELAMKSDDPAEISQRLISLAKERGGEDNVSAVVFVLQEA